MFISVIIPCRNERAYLGRCLDSILESDWAADAMEVIVADGMSDDGTRALIDRYVRADTRVRMIDNPERITPVALNRAIEAAGGDVIVRVDAHAAIAADYLLRCVHYLESTDADNVGGTMRTLPQSEGVFSGAILTAISHRFGVGNSYFRIGAGGPRWVDTVFGGCWSRDVFDRVGKFNELLERSQDMEFSLRLKAAGGKTLLVPDIRSDYYARSDLVSFARHNVLNGQWAVLPFLYSEVMPVSLRHLVPLLFVVALLIGAGALRWTPWVLASIGIPYAAANLLASAHAALCARRLSHLALLPIAFGALHLGYGFGSIVGVLKVIGKRVLTGARQDRKSCTPYT